MRVKSLSVDKKITNILKYTKHRSILWIVSTTNELKQNMENCMMLHQQMIKTKNIKKLYMISYPTMMVYQGPVWHIKQSLVSQRYPC